MTTPAPSPSAPAPKQKRSLQSQESILDATERLLAREGVSDFTLLDLSRECGMSVGGIYRRFVDKDGLMLTLQQRLNERMLQEFAALVGEAGSEKAGLAEQAATLVGAQARVLRRHAPVLRKIVEASWHHPDIARNGMAAYRANLDLFKQALLAHRADIPHDAPEYAIEFCFNATYELIASHLAFGRRLTIEEMDWPRLVANLQRMCVNYLACREFASHKPAGLPP